MAVDATARGLAASALDRVLRFFRDATNTTALRNGTSAQTLYVYNTYTDASNYRRTEYSGLGALGTAAGTGGAFSFDIGTGAGNNGALNLNTNNTARWQVGGSTGHFLASADLTYNIGAPAANRPLGAYAGFFGASITSQSGTTYTVAASDSSIIFTSASTVTLTLPAAATFAGRKLHLKTTGGAAVNSAASNVVPLAGGAASTGILALTAGKWAELQSDGTNWIIMAAN